jgi:hypothetical protein
MADLPRGTVTFLFTDIEGSTALWERDRTAMRAAVNQHLALLREVIANHDGVAFKTVGDAVQATFATAPAALAAAVLLTRCGWDGAVAWRRRLLSGRLWANDLAHDPEERVQDGRRFVGSPGSGHHDLGRLRLQRPVDDVRPLQVADRSREERKPEAGSNEPDDEVHRVGFVQNAGRDAGLGAQSHVAVIEGRF